MVQEIVRDGVTYYIHTAWADDDEGENFSIEEADTLMIGHYTDQSTDESTDPAAYSWELLDDEDIDIEDETDDEDWTDAVDDIDEDMEDDDDYLEDLEAATVVNNANLMGTQGTSDQGLGNVNELTGTNLGATGWTVSDGFSVSTVQESLTPDDPTSDVIDLTRITCTTAGAGTACFPVGGLAQVLGDATEDDAYTLSLVSRMSALFVLPVSVADADGTNVQLQFDDIDNSMEGIDDTGTDEDIEDITVGEDMWTDYDSTATATGAAYSAQVLRFDLSAMPAGATLDIANLKIEAGAMVTPWRRSIIEVDEAAATAQSTAEAAQTAAGAAQTTADKASAAASTAQSSADTAAQAAATAQSTADTAKEDAATAQTAAETAQSAADTAKSTAEATSQHFWTDDEGAHVTTTEQGETVTGGNTLITDEGMEVRDGNTTLASFKKDGAVIGANNAQKIRITDKAFEAVSADGEIAARISSEYGTEQITETETLSDSKAATLVLSFAPVAGSAITVRIPGASFSVTFTQGTAETKDVMSAFGSRTIAYDGDKTFTGITLAKFTYTSSQPNGKVLSLADGAIFAKWNGDFYAREIDTKGVTISGKSLDDLFSGKISIGTTSTGALSISAGGNTSDTAIDVDYKDGFSARCIVGWNLSGTGASNCMISKLYIHQTDQQIHYYIKNTGSAKATPTLKVYVLYTNTITDFTA